MNEQQKRFADYYIQLGNASEAYRKAGYKAKTVSSITTNANRLLTNADIVKYIEERNKLLTSDRIADMEEVKQFWTDTMRNDNNEMKDRLKASEYISKTNGAFLEKVQHSGGLDNSLTVVFDPGMDDE
ncbi:MAG: terminase small subunit [Bacillus sp. (in: firmicutes)]